MSYEVCFNKWVLFLHYVALGEVIERLCLLVSRTMCYEEFVVDFNVDWERKLCVPIILIYDHCYVLIYLVLFYFHIFPIPKPMYFAICIVTHFPFSTFLAYIFLCYIFPIPKPVAILLLHFFQFHTYAYIYFPFSPTLFMLMYLLLPLTYLI